MNFRLLNLLLAVSLLIVGIFNLNALLEPLNEAFGWQLSLPIGDGYVTQEFRYTAPEAGTVHLVWGQAGWQQMAEGFRPPGTTVEFGVLNTPMTRTNDTFVARLHLPVGAILDYGFQIRTKRDGTAIPWRWDGDHQLKLATDNLIEAQTTSALNAAQSAEQQVSVPKVTSQPRSLLSSAILQRLPGFAQLQTYVQTQPAEYRGIWSLLTFVGVLVLGSIVLLCYLVVVKSHRNTFSVRYWVYLSDLLRELVGREMKLRYRRSVLGIAWSLLNPLLQMLIFGFVFSYVLPLGVANYPLFLFSGLLVWNWLQGSLIGATTAIIDGGSLIKRPGFPAAILPVVTVSANLIHFLLSLPILALFLVGAGIEPSLTLAWLPVVIALQFVFTLSIAYFLATIHVSFRDTQHLVGILLLLFFYLTPIFYDAHAIPARFQALYHLNPIFHLIEAYRAILLHGEAPLLAPLAMLAFVSGVMLFFGYQLFMRTSYGFVEDL